MNDQISNNKLVLEFSFENFKQALKFVNQIGEIANDMCHHPDVQIHSYNQVRVESYTHDVGVITDKDRLLMARIQQIQQ